LSTQPIQPAWKQEVNQRLAAHKNRKGTAGSGGQKDQEAAPGTSRAAEAAARVAARYSKAPTYSQMQAEEARTAVRAAEIATQVAMEAQAAAHSALAELHAAAEQPRRGPAVVESIARAPRLPEPELELPLDLPSIEGPSTTPYEPLAQSAPESPAVITQEVIDGKSFNLRWEADLPARALQMPPVPPLPREQFDLAVEDWWTPAQSRGPQRQVFVAGAEVNATIHSEPIEVDATPGQANLIEFPRELVATRKLRPRLAEAAGISDREAQLSIFEVDPGTISFEATLAPSSQPDSPAVNVPGWSGMELDAHPELSRAPQVEAPAKPVHLAPLGLRAMAVVVDLALILGSFAAAGAWISSKMTHLPAEKPAEAWAIFGLLLAGFTYHALFFAFSNMTLGMRYAGIALSTFDDNVPTRPQLRRRLGAMALSLLPVGLGVVWSVFDEDHLSWHDRISGTYLRRR